MIDATKARVRAWMETLLHIHDSPHRTALAFAIGVFIGFSPSLGLHTILGLAIAFVFGFNRVAVLLGVYANLPWIIAQYYALMTAAGAWALDTQIPPGFYGSLRGLFALSIFTGEFWTQLGVLLRPLLWPYIVGSTVGAMVIAAAAYPLAKAFVVTGRRYAARYHHAHGHDRRHDGGVGAR